VDLVDGPVISLTCLALTAALVMLRQAEPAPGAAEIQAASATMLLIWLVSAPGQWTGQIWPDGPAW
jgi:hypothetical protein